MLSDSYLQSNDESIGYLFLAVTSIWAQTFPGGFSLEEDKLDDFKTQIKWSSLSSANIDFRGLWMTTSKCLAFRLNTNSMFEKGTRGYLLPGILKSGADIEAVCSHCYFLLTKSPLKYGEDFRRSWHN